MNREFLQTLQVAGQSLPEDVMDAILNRHSEALHAREAKLACREYLLEKKYPAKLLELLDTTDAARFQAAADAMAASFPGILTPEAPPYRAGTGTWQPDGAEPLADAFKIKI